MANNRQCLEIIFAQFLRSTTIRNRPILFKRLKQNEEPAIQAAF